MLTLMGRTKGSVEDEDEESRPAIQSRELVLLEAPKEGSTLLPRPLASAISGITGIASFNVRAATKIGGWGVYAGREATLKSLSVARSAAEQILILAGRDVASRTTANSLGQLEAANALESAIRLLHTFISGASFAASTGFYFTEAALESVSTLSIHGLSMMNAFFGSTETSKAVAAVISLLSTELNRPQGEDVASYRDLMVTLIGFVLLQRWGRRKTQLDFRNAGGEETIWDMVIDDRGFRADVVGTRRQETITLAPNQATHAHTHSFISPAELDNPEDAFEALERGTLFEPSRMELNPMDQAQLSDEEIREQIIRQLPSGARAVISSETFTAKTIKVEVYDSDTTNIEAPPGTIMVAERLNHDVIDDNETPRQTVVFRTALKRNSSAEVDPTEKLRLTSANDEKMDTSDHEDGIMMRTPPRPVPPPKDVSQPNVHNETNPENRKSQLQKTHVKDPVANQKKSRKPAFILSNAPENKAAGKATNAISKANSNSNEKEGKIRKAMKTLSPSSSFAAMKDAPSFLPRRKSSDQRQLPTLSRLTTPSDVTPQRVYPPMTALTSVSSPYASPSQVATPGQAAANSYFVRETRRDSIVSTTDTYSVHSIDSRAGSRSASPTFSRTQSRTMSHIKSDLGLSVKASDGRPGSSGHQRTRSFQPSLYSMASKHSGEAVVLAPRVIPRKSIYEDSDMIDTLMKDGKVPGMFPDRHLVQNIRRFARFATASYGSGFLHVMGLNDSKANLSKSSELITMNVHREHTSFSDHTGLPHNTILLSSFYDPQGVMGNTEWSPSAMSPLIHFVSLDEQSKAVVLTCRGTLGFEDVLTDMTCDYDEIAWQGQSYMVHKGIHASARRLLSGSGSRIMATLQAALEEHPDYGLVLCGHSLGGAVAAVLAILISEPSQASTSQSFVTGNPPKLLTGPPNREHDLSRPPIILPQGRPVHVYSYGTPATVSEPLRLATRGLITTVANASDIVPCLSLGTLHDFRAVALHLKHDQSDAINKLRSRVWDRIRTAFSLSMTAERTPGGPPAPENIAGEGVGEDTWAWRTLQELRGVMTNDKLVPPGEVFILESTRVFDRLGPDVKAEARFGLGLEEAGKDNTTEKVYRALGRPATRVQLKLCRDVENRFKEIRFGSGMFADHSPGRYERNLGSLEAGVCDGS
jgi:hypothetical protein